MYVRCIAAVTFNSYLILIVAMSGLNVVLCNFNMTLFKTLFLHFVLIFSILFPYRNRLYNETKKFLSNFFCRIKFI